MVSQRNEYYGEISSNAFLGDISDVFPKLDVTNQFCCLPNFFMLVEEFFFFLLTKFFFGGISDRFLFLAVSIEINGRKQKISSPKQQNLK